MKILLINVGTVRDTALSSLLNKYTSRLPFYMPFELISLPDIKTSKSLTEAVQKQREGEIILSKIDKGDFVVLFDERGRELTSREFATFIERKAATLGRNLVFIIGGPYGFSADVYERADYKLALSKMTFTHEMACVLAAEQLFRAQTIIKGEPYHHD